MRDDETRDLRARVDCRTILEREGFILYPAESSKTVWKYVRKSGGAGHQIVIVNHGGRGWFSPLDEGRCGDAFGLVQFLRPGTSFGHARVELRRLAGIAPNAGPVLPPRARAPCAPVIDRWQQRSVPRRGSATWHYLTETRGLPPATVAAAISQDIIREGPHGTVWAAHRGVAGVITGWELRGPAFKGFAAASTKGLFVFSAGDQARRLAVTEAAIDALSLAALECRADTLYASTGGGMATGTIETVRVMCTRLALTAATDANAPGDRLATQLERLAGTSFDRLRPTGGVDWNDELRRSPR